MSERIDLLDELQWRGLLKDCTDADGLRSHLADPDNAPRKIYAGFDPTADSLTIGNLVPIMLLAHVKRAGHVPVVVMGGGTGLIGDPSGKSAERMMMTEEIVQGNVDAQKPIYDAILNKVCCEGGGHDYIPLNNNDWLSKISYIVALRDIGKHFSVNMMMQKESVKERLNNREQGISYTEFSYMILQAYDFAYLFGKGVSVQLGGSDQYGNIVAGLTLTKKVAFERIGSTQDRLEGEINLLRPECNPEQWRQHFCNLTKTGLSIDGTDDAKPFNSDEAKKLLNDEFDNMPEGFQVAFLENAREVDLLIAAHHTFGLTAPLVAKADGGKFGKTETGAVWLTAVRTSPYAYYQFWLNSSDDDAGNWIKVFTFLDREAVESLIARHGENPGKRELQRTLAQEATTILHGKDAMENAELAGKALFSGAIGSLDEQTMLEVFASVPTTDHAMADLAEGLDMVEMLKSTGLASSNREARDFLKEGSVSVNGEKIDGDTKITEAHLLHGSCIAIRRGKKKWHMTKWA